MFNSINCFFFAFKPVYTDPSHIDEVRHYLKYVQVCLYWPPATSMKYTIIFSTFKPVYTDPQPHRWSTPLASLRSSLSILTSSHMDEVRHYLQYVQACLYWPPVIWMKYAIILSTFKSVYTDPNHIDEVRHYLQYVQACLYWPPATSMKYAISFITFKPVYTDPQPHRWSMPFSSVRSSLSILTPSHIDEVRHYLQYVHLVV